MHIEVTAPDPMPKLSAAVEVAVYRIASEALHNVTKHAQATTCEVRIEVEAGWLTLKVIDNGKGMLKNDQMGVGLSSMKERAVELGGRLTIQPGEPSGTCVTAQIPIDRELWRTDESMEPLTVLIADDHPVFRKGLRALLASMPDCRTGR